MWSREKPGPGYAPGSVTTADGIVPVYWQIFAVLYENIIPAPGRSSVFCPVVIPSILSRIAPRSASPNRKLLPLLSGAINTRFSFFARLMKPSNLLCNINTQLHDEAFPVFFSYTFEIQFPFIVGYVETIHFFSDFHFYIYD